ncbi:MAG: TRAP transporter substrate-binding protein [Alphaproteobacteria bacterium]|nr:TRAP transporter substrate-binding protein [Alphaproteobacteria bacterium SS10]
MSILHLLTRLTIAVTVLVTFSVTAPQTAKSAEFTFSVHHFLSARALTHTQMIEPWAKRIEEASNGRIKFEIYPAMALGGKPPELYRQVRDGVVDIAWTLPGYTPGVFPRVEVFELSGVHGGSALATNMASQSMMPMIADDFDDLHPLLVHVHSGNALHLASKPVGSLADVKGMKIRSPSRTGAWMLEAWGAEPVGMPVPALPQALAKQTVDGALVPFEVAMPLKLAELTEHGTELANGRRFGTSTFLFAMNKDAYESLPADLQAIIDEHSGAEFAAAMGKAWDAVEPKGVELARENGVEVITLDDARTAEFDALNAAITKRWLDDMAARDLDGQALVDAAKAAIADHTAEPDQGH